MLLFWWYLISHRREKRTWPKIKTSPKINFCSLSGFACWYFWIHCLKAILQSTSVHTTRQSPRFEHFISLHLLWHCWLPQPNIGIWNWSKSTWYCCNNSLKVTYIYCMIDKNPYNNAKLAVAAGYSQLQSYAPAPLDLPVAGGVEWSHMM